MDENALLQVDSAAEALWLRSRGMEDGTSGGHEEWLALPDSEKDNWRAKAQVVIANTKQEGGFA